jgi:hypothetical protein
VWMCLCLDRSKIYGEMSIMNQNVIIQQVKFLK